MERCGEWSSLHSTSPFFFSSSFYSAVRFPKHTTYLFCIFAERIVRPSPKPS